jgi:hypothetical protein
MGTLGDKMGTFVAKLKCDNCCKQYKDRTGLWRHKKTCCSKNQNIQNGNILATVDDILATGGNNLSTIKECQVANSDVFKCEFCDKSYLHRQGLWRHKKMCNNLDKEPSDKQLFMMLLKQNNELIKEHSDLKEIILEIVKNGTHNTTNNAITNNTNSHNKAFNLNFFLNETCKNAMNITDFVDSIKLQLSDFMEVGELGYVEGISNIIVKKLNALDETVRPIHCTDQKRETFYVKDEDRWEKEEEDKKRLKKLIKKVSFKNENLMRVYKENYPDYNDPESKRSDQYSKTVIEAMDCKEESREKIIKNISRATVIKSKP